LSAQDDISDRKYSLKPACIIEYGQPADLRLGHRCQGCTKVIIRFAGNDSPRGHFADRHVAWHPISGAQGNAYVPVCD
jgi:hypothetical protein